MCARPPDAVSQADVFVWCIEKRVGVGNRVMFVIFRSLANILFTQPPLISDDTLTGYFISSTNLGDTCYANTFDRWKKEIFAITIYSKCFYKLKFIIIMDGFWLICKISSNLLDRLARHLQLVKLCNFFSSDTFSILNV